MNSDYTYTPAEPAIEPAPPPAQRRTIHPNFLLVLIMLILMMARVVLIYDRYFSERVRAEATTTEQVAPTGEPLPKVGRESAVRVEDSHCAGGYGWQWTEAVEDLATGQVNGVIVSSCNQQEN